MWYTPATGSPCFSSGGIHFKDRRNISIGCKGDSRRRFSAGQLAKGCTKSWPDISRVYQSQCGSGVPRWCGVANERRRGERKREREREREGCCCFRWLETVSNRRKPHRCSLLCISALRRRSVVASATIGHDRSESFSRIVERERDSTRPTLTAEDAPGDA